MKPVLPSLLQQGTMPQSKVSKLRCFVLGLYRIASTGLHLRARFRPAARNVLIFRHAISNAQIVWRRDP